MKQHIALRAAAVLLCLTLASACLLSGMLARYTAGGSAGDRARTAAFGQLTLTYSGAREGALLPGVDIPMDPRVSMEASEVAVAVYVDVTVNGAWQFDKETKTFSAHGGLLTWTVDDWGLFKKNDTNTYTFRRLLAPGERILDAPVVQKGVILVNKEMEYDAYYDLTEEDLEIGFSVRAVQMD